MFDDPRFKDSEGQFDLVLYQRHLRDERARVARERRTANDQLPLRPNLGWYRDEARRRLRVARLADRESRLSDVQHTIAVELGFRHWRSFVCAVNHRNTRAACLSRAVQARDEHIVRHSIQTDLCAVLDVGCRATPDDLRWIRNLADSMLIGAAVLVALHDAIAERQEAQVIADSLRAVTTIDTDWQYAIDVIITRRVAIEDDPLRIEEREAFDEALSELDMNDQPETEYIGDWD